MTSAQTPAGEYRCDFYEIGCEFVTSSRQSESRHYKSSEDRHEHLRLIKERLRSLQDRVAHLEQKCEQNQQEIDQNQLEIRLQRQEIDQNQLEIEELKQRLRHLEETHNERVISVWELSTPDLVAEDPGWHSCRTQEFGYGLDIQARLLESPTGAEFRFRLRLRPTPHDRTLRWPFRSAVRVDVFPPDGRWQLPERISATLLPDRLPTDQLRMLGRPGTAGDRESIEFVAPAGIGLDQLRDLPDGSSFATRAVLL
ncbi:hypothetical protein BOX15_Mlig016784g1 [Macrostomum lignano]|uniref:Uncharacterized protein n=1 Tax=Macrostomum lignano TaxID=282301 RepID=A0A267GQY0_9PLAT|nr:hypothetical protein BOX15_Mlig016784g1 [Macrostomum lignano]